MTARRRLTPQDRRAEILDVAARHFAEAAYDEVRVDDVAQEAGVSRAMLYRYFPGKRELFTGVYQLAADRLLDASTLDPSLPLAQQVQAGLDAHLDYFVANARTVITANRTLAGDPVIQAIIDGELRQLQQRLILVSGLRGRRAESLAAVLMAWLVFVRVLTVDWLGQRLEHPRSAYSRRQLRAVFTGALLGALAGVPGGDLGTLGEFGTA